MHIYTSTGEWLAQTKEFLNKEGFSPEDDEPGLKVNPYAGYGREKLWIALRPDGAELKIYGDPDLFLDFEEVNTWNVRLNVVKVTLIECMGRVAYSIFIPSTLQPGPWLGRLLDAFMAEIQGMTHDLNETKQACERSRE